MLENEKQDAKKSYKNTNGYHPNFSFIGRLPVHIENHNGNTPAKYKQLETLKRCFKNLKDNDIKIEHFRGDSASYQKEVLEFLSENAQYFYIRNISSQNFISRCGKIKDWKTIYINNEKKEVASMIYTPFKGEFSYRVVVTRTLKKNQQIDLLSGTPYNYYGIMTRYKIEAKNSELKNVHGYDRAISYGISNMQMQGAIAIFTVNLKRILKLM